MKVVIIGGGFGGLAAAQKMSKGDIEITIIDKTNHHLFQPLLYQVATASLSPGDIATPIRAIFNDQRNVKVVMAEALSINKEQSVVYCDDNLSYEYDYIIVASGARHSYFGKDEWEENAPGLKTLSDALKIREKILLSLELAEKCTDSLQAKKYLTFAIIGGGPTGVELAGAIAEIVEKILTPEFRNINPKDVKIYLVEATNKILGMYPEELSKRAEEDILSLGVEIIKGKPVTEVSEAGIKLGEQIIESSNIIWAAGNIASPLLKTLGVECDRAGRVIVDNDLTIPGFPNVFIIGDAAAFKDENGNFLPAVAPVANQEGKYVANLLLNKTDVDKREKFKYSDRGMMATIGRAKAVALIKGFKLSGVFAWLTWSVVHVMFLISFRNRFRVMAEWIWYYVTMRHGIRLIVNRNGNSKPNIF